MWDPLVVRHPSVNNHLETMSKSFQEEICGPCPVTNHKLGWFIVVLIDAPIHTALECYILHHMLNTTYY